MPGAAASLCPVERSAKSRQSGVELLTQLVLVLMLVLVASTLLAHLLAASASVTKLLLQVLLLISTANVSAFSASVSLTSVVRWCDPGGGQLSPTITLPCTADQPTNWNGNLCTCNILILSTPPPSKTSSFHLNAW